MWKRTGFSEEMTWKRFEGRSGRGSGDASRHDVICYPLLSANMGSVASTAEDGAAGGS
jgi:hypothetical protein